MDNQTMKIGVFSDIHAKMKPLHKTMAVFDAAGVDDIICAGDLVERGHEGDAVVSYIRQHDIPTVQGNHDHDASQLRRRVFFGGLAGGHSLEPETVNFLSDLPLTRHFTWAGGRVCLAHGTPWSNIEYLFPSSDVNIFRRVAEQAEADVVITGHTHIPMKARLGDTWFFNPGSASQNRGAFMSRSCGVLTLPDVQFEVYDIDTGEPLPVEFIPLDEV